MDANTQQPTPAELPLFASNPARLRHWRTKLELFKAVQGVRPLLDHVTEEQWLAHYAANEDAFSAVVEELRTIEG